MKCLTTNETEKTWPGNGEPSSAGVVTVYALYELTGGRAADMHTSLEKCGSEIFFKVENYST